MAVTVALVKDRILANLKQAALEGWWDDICTDALASAVADVYGVLIGRGFASADVDAWPHRDSYVSDQAVYWSAVNAGMLEAFDSKFIDLLQKRFEGLKTVPITGTAGGLVNSAAIGHGPMRTKPDGDVFTDAQGVFRPW